jgi:thymidylate synthase (FAD)
MTVTVEQATPLYHASMAARTCWASQSKSDNGGEKDMKLVDRLYNKERHESIVEHSLVTFKIEGISRACLQELARHRHQSLSVESTRYTLSKLLNAEEALWNPDMYIVKTGNELVDAASWSALMNLVELAKQGVPNDLLKYALPESWKVNLYSSWNLRGLGNFLSLRCKKEALWEIRELANTMYDALPSEWRKVLMDKAYRVEDDD